MALRKIGWAGAVLLSMSLVASPLLAAAAQQQTARVRVGGDIKEPKKIKHVAPVYPEDAQKAGIQGVIILECILGTDGSVHEAKILRGVAQLDKAALDAVMQWMYTPTLLNGQPVEVIMTVTVTFTIGEPSAVHVLRH